MKVDVYLVQNAGKSILMFVRVIPSVRSFQKAEESHRKQEIATLALTQEKATLALALLALHSS